MNAIIFGIVLPNEYSSTALQTLQLLSRTMSCELWLARPPNAFAVLNQFLDQIMTTKSPPKYIVFADVTKVNDRVEGVSDAINILKAELLDVATANQRIYYYDRANFRKWNTPSPWRSYWPTAAIVPTRSSYGGLALYRSKCIGSTRFQSTNFASFNLALSDNGASIAVVPWLLNSGYDSSCIALLIVALIVLFVILATTKKFFKISTEK